MIVKIKSIYDRYSFKNNWIMELNLYTNETKTIYLGDPQNFCVNVLNTPSSMITEKLGVLDFKRLRDQHKLGTFISDKLSLDEVEIVDMTNDEFYEKYLKV